MVIGCGFLSRYAGVVEALLARGVGPDWQDDKGQTALMAAAIHSHEAVAKLLIAKGALVDAMDQSQVRRLRRIAKSLHDLLYDIVSSRKEGHFGSWPPLSTRTRPWPSFSLLRARSWMPWTNRRSGKSRAFVTSPQNEILGGALIFIEQSLTRLHHFRSTRR
jgi:ankyrin repeat protein